MGDRTVGEKVHLGWLAAIAVVGMGCGSSGGTPGPDVSSCTNAIAAKEALVAAMLPGWPVADAPEMIAAPGGDESLDGDYAGKYRDDLVNHPGCIPRSSYGPNSEFLMTDNESTVPSGSAASNTTLPGYPCAAKIYDQPSEDTSKPIVILVHGNSSGVNSFEEYFVASRAGTSISNYAGFTFTVDSAERPMLASKLLDLGYRVIAFDARTDLVATLGDFNPDVQTGNAYRNIDHGWAVPMLQSLLAAVIDDNPGRQVSIVAHSLGATVTRDALRRMYVGWKNGDAGAINPYAHLKDVVLLSGANHGVANGDLLCTSFPTQMRGTVTCEMGDRAAFVPTYFTKRINGPSDLFAAPCADGDYAFGEHGQCDGNVVQYTTVTMQDVPGGMLQDEFVSEASSKLDLEPCVDNELIGLGDYDSSGFFFTAFPGFIANHFGSPRSDAGMQIILNALSD